MTINDIHILHRTFAAFKVLWIKNCFWCGSSATKKNSQKRNKQLYKCKSFGRQFVGGFRLDDEVLKSEYIEGNQTLDQFASKYNVNKSTIGRRFKSMCHVHVISRHKEVVINMDTTYWGRNFGLMVIKDSFVTNTVAQICPYRNHYGLSQRCGVLAFPWIHYSRYCLWWTTRLVSIPPTV